MEYEAREICDIMERLLARNEADTAWYLQETFSRIYNKQAPNSEERVLMADIWKRMMLKWH